MFQLYQSKPTEIEAYRLTEYMLDRDEKPDGVSYSDSLGHYVTTIQGRHVTVSPGEWIVKERDGKHHYPVADDVFRAKYECDRY